MAETTYTTITWTAGDFITEAKMDNMVANDRAVDAMEQGIELVERADPSTPAGNRLHLYAKDKAGVPTLYVINDAGTIYELAESTPCYEFPIASEAFVTSLAAPPLLVIRDSEIVSVNAYANTAPVGASLIFDINLNGTTIWSTQANRVTITASAQTGSQSSFNTTDLSENDVLTLDVDQVGSSTPGSDIVVKVKTK